MEFLVSRLDPLKQGDAATGRAVPVCRLVLTAAAAVELIRASGQITSALVQAGVLRQTEGRRGADRQAELRERLGGANGSARSAARR